MKLDNSAFLYLDPEPGCEDFAQCSSCRMWVSNRNRCTIHGPRIEVKGSASCGLYICGEPIDDLLVGLETVVTPTESGLVDHKVRCENCRWGGPEVYTCRLYEDLNDQMHETFDLDPDIDPKGCCNAHQPR